MRSGILSLVILLSLSSPAEMIAADTDDDGLEDGVDNCVEVGNVQCDTDQDGFGNACDGDYNQDGIVDAGDLNIFFADLNNRLDSGVGTDADCDGVVDAGDFNLFSAQLFQGVPGPSGLLCASLVPCVDVDHDGLADHLDNCTAIANGGAAQCDTDQDGFGNACDGDYNQDGIVDAGDSNIFFADLNNQLDSGVGTDANCDGVVDAGDSNLFFAQLFQGVPGPSGLSCAGEVPCFGVDPNVTQEVVFSDTPWGFRLEIATDSQGRMHGIYAAGEVQASRLRYVTQPGPDAALAVETVVELAAGEVIGLQMFDIVLDSNEQPCVVWQKSISGNAWQTFYGCRGQTGFSFDQDISVWVPRTSSSIHLALDSQDFPHMVFYQHLPLDSPGNHRVRHVWRDAAGWHKNTPRFPQGYVDPASEGCLAIDVANRAHVALGVHHDPVENPPADLHGALAHAIWDPLLFDPATDDGLINPTNGWDATSIIRPDVGGGISPNEIMKPPCELAVADDGGLHVAYLVQPEPGGSTSLFYGTNAGTVWTFTDLGVGVAGGPSTLELDAAGNAFFSAPRPALNSVDLVRIGAGGNVDTWTFGPLSRPSASSVWNPTPDQTTCRVLAPRPFTIPPQFLLTTVTNCDEP